MYYSNDALHLPQAYAIQLQAQHQPFLSSLQFPRLLNFKLFANMPYVSHHALILVEALQTLKLTFIFMQDLFLQKNGQILVIHLLHGDSCHQILPNVQICL